MWPISEVDQRRVWSHVTTGDGCWLWTASRTGSGGDGQIMIASTMQRAHRVAWAIAQRRDPVGHVLHRCDNPPCVNPAHLFEGTTEDNVRDMEQKGRARHPHGVAHGRAKLTEAIVRTARVRRSAGEGLRQLAREFRVGHRTLSAAVSGRTWAHVTAD